MAEKTGAELKEYLKRAADLESMLYSYEQTKDLLQQTVASQVTEESRSPGHYQYGDKFPRDHYLPGTRPQYVEIRLSYVGEPEGEVYTSPPNGYLREKNAPKKEGLASMAIKTILLNLKSTFSDIKGLFSLILGCALAGVVGGFVITFLLWGFEKIKEFKPCFIRYSMYCGIAAFVLFLIWMILHDLNRLPWGESYWAAKASYEEAVDQRNAVLAKEQGIEAYCVRARQEIAPMEARVREELGRHYAQNVIHPKYRNFVAVTQIHEYLETGRCSTLDGPDGAYNLFERELRANQIIAQLSQIVVRLDEIRQLQYEIVAAIQATNGLLAGISQDISSLESAVNVNTAAINDFNASVSYQLAHR